MFLAGRLPICPGDPGAVPSLIGLQPKPGGTGPCLPGPERTAPAEGPAEAVWGFVPIGKWHGWIIHDGAARSHGPF
jgi:hypothetical protein